MRSVRSLVVAVLASVVLVLPAVALADGRVALVVGNSTYTHIGRLPNPDNDARDISAAVRRLGFEVTTEFDADRVALTEALCTLRPRARAGQRRIDVPGRSRGGAKRQGSDRLVSPFGRPGQFLRAGLPRSDGPTRTVGACSGIAWKPLVGIVGQRNRSWPGCCARSASETRPPSEVNREKDFFADLTQDCMRAGSFASVAELVGAHRDWNYKLVPRCSWQLYINHCPNRGALSVP